VTRSPGRLSSSLLARIVESSDDAIVSKDLDGIVQFWNDAAERIFGYRADEMIGRSIRIIIPADRQHEEDFVLGRIRAGQTVRHYETIRQRKDGQLIPISVTVSPVHDGDGGVIGASKIARDITERVRLEQAALDQANMSRRLSEIGSAISGSLDRTAIVQKVTDMATEATGAAFGAFFHVVEDPKAGRTFTLSTLSGARKEAFARFEAPRATGILGPTLQGEGIVRLDDVTEDPRYGQTAPHHGMPDGHLPVRSYLAVPVTTPDGRVIGGLLFGHPDAGVFSELDEQLAAGVASWTSVALENARLYGEARTADRLKDEFLAVLSHELRTPLNAILGYARLLRGGMLTGEKADRGLETLERNASALTQIVEDVLDISRIVSGKIRLDVQPVELQLVIHNSIATVQPAADAKQIRLQTVIDPTIGPVSGDPNRLQQVVWNLLSNAVKFTPKGGRVQVRLERVNSHVEIIVSDTGSGIKPEFLPHVFERFRQADAGTTRKTGGLGLGLSIVRHIVELHGGSVTAASEGEHKGATFRVKLPLMIVHASGVRERREHPRTRTVEPLVNLDRLDDITVLAIDDEADARGLLVTVLEAAGARVVTESSAAQALEVVTHARPDVLLVDLGMPGMDGFEFITRLRALEDERVRDLPAAALTAFARAEDRTRALQSGFEMHLAKPVDPGELVASVARLARRRARG